MTTLCRPSCLPSTPRCSGDGVLCAATRRSPTIRVPGIAVPVYRSFEQRAQVTSIAPAVHYQFFRNQWFHPLLGAGVSLDRDRVRRVYPEQPVPIGANGGAPWVQLPREEQPTRTTIVLRPLLLGGFKAYVASRAFLRSDVSATFAVRSRAVGRENVPEAGVRVAEQALRLGRAVGEHDDREVRRDPVVAFLRHDRPFSTHRIRG